MEPPDHSIGSLVGAAPNGVGDGEFRKINDLFADLPGLKTEVNVFAIHDKFWVEVADLVQEFPTDKKRSARNPINFLRLVMFKVLH